MLTSEITDGNNDDHEVDLETTSKIKYDDDGNNDDHEVEDDDHIDNVFLFQAPAASSCSGAASGCAAAEGKQDASWDI